ncbi:SDR family NAD(P)-dependent oxidoreductase [Oceanobacillus sp. CAU 1775]
MKIDEFQGKTVYISGAASEIGLAQSEEFLKLGANVFAIDREERDLQRLKQEYPDTFSYWIVDVRIQEEIAESFTVALNQFRKIDILVNTISRTVDNKASLDTTEDVWDDVMEMNVKSIYYITNLMLPHMMKWDNGVIINMASLAGGDAAYTTAKHAILGYTKQLSEDYDEKGIRVYAVTPNDAAIPLEVAAQTLLLASESTVYKSGTVIQIDDNPAVK